MLQQNCHEEAIREPRNYTTTWSSLTENQVDTWVVVPTSMMKSLHTILLVSTIIYSSSVVRTVNCYQRSTSSPSKRQTKHSAWDDDLATTSIAPPGRVPSQRTHAAAAWGAISSLVRVFRGGEAFVNLDHAAQKDMNGLDRTFRTASVWLASVVAGQAMATLVQFNEDLLHEVCVCVRAPALGYQDRFETEYCACRL